MFDKARVYQVHSQPRPHALFQIDERKDGSPVLAKIKLGYVADADRQAHALADNLPIAFFVAYEEK